ncbi:hypothetical protein FA09DRAFT_140672 [Tilletiopsis washingtonensis]|jgi:hypothetical protein|uniref:Uncharacterized protein n=1 Tax=Tilletiopsis washingtonensis TaxID=58919 RepID=A0A316Z2Z5_9BASI|nr:hypothetical protein FA09DRAFT_140672 [Tilletiopsis washingtonensis]PWN95454.1 hypothetical protein FA09DRAFT_140672 [Tilletiopsis washingtonensis]
MSDGCSRNRAEALQTSALGSPHVPAQGLVRHGGSARSRAGRVVGIRHLLRPPPCMRAYSLQPARCRLSALRPLPLRLALPRLQRAVSQQRQHSEARHILSPDGSESVLLKRRLRGGSGERGPTKREICSAEPLDALRLHVAARACRRAAFAATSVELRLVRASLLPSHPLALGTEFKLRVASGVAAAVERGMPPSPSHHGRGLVRPAHPSA